MEERFMPVAHGEGRPIDQRSSSDDGTFGSPADPLGDPRALQILTTEHWSLLTARSLVYNESFTRAGMFLALLSATLVALGLISTGTGFSDPFLVIVAAVLGLDLFVGLGSIGRISTVSTEELKYTQGMNRLRHAYFETVPGLEPYFITSGHDDFESVAAFYSPPMAGPLGDFLHGLTTIPGMLSVICSALAGGLAGVLILLLSHDPALAGMSGLVVSVGAFLGLIVYSVKAVRAIKRGFEAKFPQPARSEPPRRT